MNPLTRLQLQDERDYITSLLKELHFLGAPEQVTFHLTVSFTSASVAQRCSILIDLSGFQMDHLV